MYTQPWKSDVDASDAINRYISKEYGEAYTMTYGDFELIIANAMRPQRELIEELAKELCRNVKFKPSNPHEGPAESVDCGTCHSCRARQLIKENKI